MTTLEHGTKRTVAELATGRPFYPFFIVHRDGGTRRVCALELDQDFGLKDLELKYNSDFHGWTARISKGLWRQVCLLEPFAEK